MEFVSENEDVISAYRADESDTASLSVQMASPKRDQDSREGKFSSAPTSPNHEDKSNADRSDLMSVHKPLNDAILLEPRFTASLNEPDESKPRASTRLERNLRAKSPELKFQSFRKRTNFDVFRPGPRSHFSSDAMSVWPLRSIEESRLLQHFIQNIAPWVFLSLKQHVFPLC